MGWAGRGGAGGMKASAGSTNGRLGLTAIPIRRIEKDEMKAADMSATRHYTTHL